MRNLQKILALVLALVMSFSLMATAGAEFTDQADIDDAFAESVDVLNGLEVFQGYPTGDFQPKGEITRAEVAAIIYRIATGDVDDTQVGIYADYDKFSDVYASETYSGWAAGYINYCANAEYIKGRGDGKFYPQDKVTGYEALAMILRVVGYDKNGEFTGADWQVQTAAIANQQKVTKNVNAGLLGQPATREMVAELLCQAILIPTVNYTLAYGYQQSTNEQDTVAYQTFKMEKLTGVVTGNEIADLKTDGGAMASNYSRMLFADGREETVNFSTGLEALGLSVRAYIVPKTGTTYKELVTGKTYATDDNNIYETSASVSSSSLNETNPSSAIKEAGINSLVGAEHFINYDQTSEWTARSTIRYAMDVQWTEREAFTMLRDNGGELWKYTDNNGVANNAEAKKGTSEGKMTKPGKEDAATWSNQFINDLDYTYHYEKTVYLDTKLSQDDWNNLYNIFTYANRLSATGAHIDGEVHVGTTQVNEDISDVARWEDFIKTYLTGSDVKQKVTSNGLGNWLRVIDNNNDGVADYVLQTIYTVGKVAANGKNLDNVGINLTDEDGSNKDNVNNTTVSMSIVSSTGHYLVPSEEALAAGDVVVYAVVAGKIRAQKAESLTSRITTVNRADLKVTLADGETVLTESKVHEHAEGLQSGVTALDGNTNYTMFLDFFGNLAAFTEGANGGLVLVTNGWYNNTISGPEYAVQAYVDGENGRSLQTVNLASDGSLFVNNNTASSNTWNQLRGDFGASTINSGNPNSNAVKTIVANLEGNVLTPVDQVYRYSQVWRMLDMRDNVIPGRDNSTTSWATAYQTQYTNTNTPAYNTQITNETTSAAAPAANVYEVRALADTVYYVVSNGIGNDPTVGANRANNVVIQTYVGYANMPKIDNTYIEDVYAVGTKHTAAATSGAPVYYTADVVVIELKDGYNGHKVHAEQVFIPDFYQVTGNATSSWGGWEEITMIRGNGELQENVKVDLRHSEAFRSYDIVNGTTISSLTLQPGLYYMDPTDADPNVYVIEKMDPSDIRASAYMVGYVSKDLSGNNYPQVEIMARPETVPVAAQDAYVGSAALTSTNAATAALYYPVDAGEDLEALQSKEYVPGTSKTYTYGGTTATLKAAEAYDVFSQVRADQLEGNTIKAINERWVVGTSNPGLFTNNDRNEILVRYDEITGKIIYAISFDKKDAAQVAWWNSMPYRYTVTLDNPDSSGLMNQGEAVNNGGVDGVDYIITLSHWEVMKLMNEHPSWLLVDVNSLSNTVKDFTLQRRIEGVDQDWVTVNRTERDLNQFALDLANTNDKVTYKLTINLNQGGTVVYNLVKEAAAKLAGLGIKSGSPVANTAGASVGNGVITFGTNTDKLGIKAFINSFEIPSGATAKWTIHRYGNTTVVVTGKNNSDNTAAPTDYGYEPEIGDNETMWNVDYVEVTVTSEDTRTGQIKTESYIGGNAANTVQARANALKQQAQNLVDNSGVAGDGNVTTKLDAIKDALDAAATDATGVALETYLNGAYKTDLANLEAAIASAKNITLKLNASVFDGTTFAATAKLSPDNINVGTTAVLVGSNVTLTVTRPVPAPAKEYVFTATKGGTTTVKTDPVSFAEDEASKTITLTLGYGAWELSAAEVKTDPVSVTFSNATNATVMLNGQVANSGFDMNPGGESKTISVEANSGYVLVSVSASAPSCLTNNGDGTWTIAIPNTYGSSSLTITITTETVADVETAVEEAQKIATAIKNVSGLSTAASEALGALQNAKTQADVSAAMSDLKTALGANQTDTLVAPVPAELPGKPGQAVENTTAAAALSGGVVVASPATFPANANGVKVFGTPDTVYTKTTTATAAQVKALNALWWGNMTTNDANIVDTIFTAIERGDFTSGQAVTGVDSFAYICIPNDDGGQYTGDDAWVMVYKTINGSTVAYTAVNWQPDVSGISW